MDHRRIIVKTLLKRSGENSKNIVKQNTQNTLQKDFILVTHSKPVDNSTTTKVIDTNTMKCELIVEKVHLKLFMSNWTTNFSSCTVFTPGTKGAKIAEVFPGYPPILDEY